MHARHAAMIMPMRFIQLHSAAILLLSAFCVLAPRSGYPVAYEASTLHNAVSRSETVQGLFAERWSAILAGDPFLDLCGRINWVPAFKVNTVTMTGGNKQTQRDSLINRVNQDTDNTSATFAEYQASDTGNGRRLVGVPITTWFPEYRVIGFAAFFRLLPSEYPQSGNKSFCAEYVGPYVQGSWHPGAGGPGAYVVRLVR